jgi:hypothetical protein
MVSALFLVAEFLSGAGVGSSSAIIAWVWWAVPVVFGPIGHVPAEGLGHQVLGHRLRRCDAAVAPTLPASSTEGRGASARAARPPG